MSASAQRYVYERRVSKGYEEPEPTVSAETLEEYKKHVAKYLPKNKINKSGNLGTVCKDCPFVNNEEKDD